MKYLRTLPQHKNVTESIAVYEDEKHYYFVMEFVIGGNLLKFINRATSSDARKQEELV